jgi:hypothetical protein
LRVHPSSWTSRWWNEHTRMRLSRSVRPPRCHQTMWCAWVKVRVPHPGNRHSPSRSRRCRIIHADGSRASLPSPTGSPESFSATICTRALQSSRRVVSAWIAPPSSTSHPPSPDASAARARGRRPSHGWGPRPWRVEGTRVPAPLGSIGRPSTRRCRTASTPSAPRREHPRRATTPADPPPRADRRAHAVATGCPGASRPSWRSAPGHCRVNTADRIERRFDPV